MNQSPDPMVPSTAPVGSHNPTIDDSTSSIVSSSTLASEAIQESSAAGSHKDHQAHLVRYHDTNQQQRPNGAKKSFKTEYKSNFTPFDQYVYNEKTDSFVKAQRLQSGANDNSAGPKQLSALEQKSQTGGSSQDLSGTFELSSSTISPALEVSSFEPLKGSNRLGQKLNEPWYKEVVKRNEKANEYRFKSEVGHNSPLLRSSNEDLAQAMRKSPGANDAPIGNDAKLSTELGTVPSGTSSAPGTKHSIRFTPNDYKHDHYIAHMANNNNFNLPKESQTGSSVGAGVRPLTALSSSQPRRTQATSSRTATTAQARARSQSSRRQASKAATATCGAEPTSKSNQTTPTKSALSTSSARAVTPSSRLSSSAVAASRYKAPNATIATSSTGQRPPISTSGRPRVVGHSVQNGSSRPATAAASGGLARRTPTSTETRLTGVGGSRVTPRVQVAAKASTTSAPTPSKPTAARAPISAPRPAAARAPAASSSSTRPKPPATGSSTRSPVKQISRSTAPGAVSSGRTSMGRTGTSTPAPNSSRPTPTPPAGKTAPSSPRRGSTSGQAASQSSSNEVKSIKTPKAIESANAKAAAAAAALATSVAAVAVGAAVASTAEAKVDQVAQVPLEAERQTVDRPIEQFEELSGGHHPFAAQEQNNLIFTTTQAGNMLADEIAQAERAASETSNLDGGLNSSETDGDPLAREEDETNPILEIRADVEEKQIFDNSNGQQNTLDDSSKSVELVNGLSGGLVSAEDHFDSSEREGSSSGNSIKNLEGPSQQGTGGDDEHDANDEPYSLIPTNYANDQEPPQTETVQEIEEQSSGDAPKFQVENSEFGANDDVSIETEKSENDRFKTITLSSEQLLEQNVDLDAQESTDRAKRDATALEDEEQKVQLVEEIKQRSDNLEALNEFRDKFDEEEEKEDDFKCDPQQLSANASEHNEKLTQAAGDSALAQELESAISEDILVHQDRPDIDLQPPSPDFERPDEPESFEILREESRDEFRTQKSVTIDQAETKADERLESDELVGSDEIPSRLDSSDSRESNVIDAENIGGKTVGHDEIGDSSSKLETSQANDADNKKIIESLNRQTEEEEEEEETKNTDEAVIPVKPDVSDGAQRYDYGDGDQNNAMDTQLASAQVAAKAKADDDEGKSPTGLNIEPKSEQEESDDSLENLGHATKQHELLMNVADLIDIEASKKQEMARKADLARQQSLGSAGARQIELHGDSEILLSPDQLHDQFAQLSGESNAPLAGQTLGDGFADSKSLAGTQQELASSRSELEADEIEQFEASEKSDNLNKQQARTVALDNDPKLSDQNKDQDDDDDDQQREQKQQQQQHRSSLDQLGSQHQHELVAKVSCDASSKAADAATATSVIGGSQRDGFGAGSSMSELDSQLGDQDRATIGAGAIVQSTEFSTQMEPLDSHLNLTSNQSTNLDSTLEEDSAGVEQAATNQSSPVKDSIEFSAMNLDLTDTPTGGQIDGSSSRLATGAYGDNFVDEIDNDEHLKLSNHLTNSDDELILLPPTGETAASSLAEPQFSPHRSAATGSRYNEGAGLAMMGHGERVEADLAELADGSSAEIVAPTAAENRVEVATSKITAAELPQVAPFISSPKLAHRGAEMDDDDADFMLNPEVDPIDIAATMSPSSSVAEEMLRLSREASNPMLEEHEKVSSIGSLDQLEAATGNCPTNEVEQNDRQESSDGADLVQLAANSVGELLMDVGSNAATISSNNNNNNNNATKELQDAQTAELVGGNQSASSSSPATKI